MSEQTQSESHAPKSDATDGATHQAGAFDIRSFISMLIGIYGVVLVVTGIIGTSDDALDRAGGLNINLWAGIGMVVVAVLFQAWAMARPVRVPDEAGSGAPASAQETGHK